MKDEAAAAVEMIGRFRERLVEQHAEELRKVDDFLAMLQGERTSRGEGVTGKREDLRDAPGRNLKEELNNYSHEWKPLCPDVKRMPAKAGGLRVPTLREVLSEFARRHRERGFTKGEAIAGVRERGLALDEVQVSNGLRNMVHGSKELRAEGKGEERRYFPGIASRMRKAQAQISNSKPQREETAQEKLHRQIREEIKVPRDPDEYR